MSTIMKALQRLEAQKKEAPPSSLQEEVVLRAAQLNPARLSRKKWIIAGAVLFGCVAATLGFFLHKRGSEVSALRNTPPTAVPAVPVERAQPSPSALAEAPALGEQSIFPPADTEPASPPETVSPDRGEFVTRERVSAMPTQEPASLSAAIAQKRSREAATEENFVQAKIDSSSPATKQAEIKSTESTSSARLNVLQATKPMAPAKSEMSAAVVATEPSAATQIENTASALEPTPQSMPPVKPPEPATAATVEIATQKNVDSRATVFQPHSPEVPDFRIRRTVWHPQPERRIAVVELMATQEMINLNEGDTIGTLTVKEITPSQVIFLNGVVEVARRVGNLP